MEERNRKAALLFRSAGDIARTSKEFEMRGIRTIPFEAIETICLGGANLESAAGKADYLIFISRNAVLCSATHIDKGSIKARVMATGISTARLLDGMGFEVAFAPAVGGISSVIKRLGEEAPGRVVALCERHSDFDFTPLEERGFSLDKAAAYEARAKTMKIGISDVFAATHAAFFSPLEVESLMSSADAATVAALKKLKAVCLGRKTYEAASAIFSRVSLAKLNSISGMADEIAGDGD